LAGLRMTVVKTLYFDGRALQLLDQRALPGRVSYLACESAAETAEAIRALVVRGAPAIGVAAAFGVVLAVEEAVAGGGAVLPAIESAIVVLAKSRPTAVNLFWALDRMRSEYDRVAGLEPKQILEALIVAAQRILDDDIASCRAIGEHGAPLLPEKAQVLTHCN